MSSRNYILIFKILKKQTTTTKTISQIHKKQKKIEEYRMGDTKEKPQTVPSGDH